MNLNFKRGSLSAVGVSFLVHSLALGSLALVVQQVKQIENLVAIDTLFEEERTQEEFEQEIAPAEVVATSVNYQSGGTVSGVIGGGGSGGGGGGPGTPGVSQRAIDESASLAGPEVGIAVGGGVDLSGFGSGLGDDLGEGKVTGEVGAAVEGYGAALSRVTQEIVRHMRSSKVLVVWLFDESNSMTDDQIEIKNQFHKVYEELGIVEKEDKELRSASSKDKEVLQTMIYGYGKELHQLMKAPSSDLAEIRKAIGNIKEEESGLENTCMAINAVVQKYGPAAKSQKRKLMVVLVTDESGSDGRELIDAAIDRVKKYEVPVYIMGREAVFGFPFARLRWRDPKYGLDHWLTIDRGPETPEPEALQYDGLHARWDAYSSGFGPYEQVRLAKESGGIFFVLPGEEENLVGQGAVDKRKFAFYDMKEYVPSLESRRDYINERKKSRFRETLWEVVVALNPFLDKELNVQEHHYPFAAADFQKTALENYKNGLHGIKQLKIASVLLEKIKPLRKQEEAARWRANYDLMLAQVYAYRVRLFQAMLALEQHAKNPPVPKDKKSNEWHLQRTPTMLAPDAKQVKYYDVSMAELKEEEEKARKLLAEVIKNHPRTPWANRAEYELANGFGFRMIEGWRDPRYSQAVGIKLPKP